MDCAPTTGRDAPWSLYLVPTVRSEVDPPFWAISGGERRNERKENDFDGSLDWVTTFWKDLRILDPHGSTHETYKGREEARYLFCSDTRLHQYPPPPKKNMDRTVTMAS